MARIALPASLLQRPVAHRALHDRHNARIENAPASIKAAIAAGYAIEIDLQLSKDGQAMVFHDETLDRLTDESGFVNERTAAQLGEIKLKGSHDFIPSFAEVLAMIDGQVPLLVELKDQTLTMSDHDGALEHACAKLLADYKGAVAVMSFNPHSVAHMARLAPQIARGITTSAYEIEDWAPLAAETCNLLRDIPDYDRVEASFISHEASDLARPRVTELRAQGADVLCWTIKSLEAEHLARKLAQNVTFEAYLAPFQTA